MVNNIKKEMRKLLDYVNSGYIEEKSSKKMLKEDHQVIREAEEFTDALRQKITNNEYFQKGDVHQAILEVAYDDWKNNDQMGGYTNMIHHTLDTYGPLAAFAVLAGKHNQQVGNGGHMQYFDNGYAGGENGAFNRRSEDDVELHHMLIELAERYNIASLGPVAAQAIDIYNEWKPYMSDCEDCGGDGEYDDQCQECYGSGSIEHPEEEGGDEVCPNCDGDGREQGTCGACNGSGEEGWTGEANNLDTTWYRISDNYMELLNNFFASKLKSDATQESFNHVEETATSGGSSAGSIASVPGSLGAGFGGDPSASIYHKGAKSKKKMPIIKRPPQ